MDTDPIDIIVNWRGKGRAHVWAKSLEVYEPTDFPASDPQPPTEEDALWNDSVQDAAERRLAEGNDEDDDGEEYTQEELAEISRRTAKGGFTKPTAPAKLKPELFICAEPDTPAPAIDEELVKYIGLTDNLEIAKLIGLPIDFKVENIGHVVPNLRTIIGLPVGSDVRVQAEKIQRDHFWVHSTCVALQWAAKEAKTTLESWEASQISRNWAEAREQYERDTKRWKAKEIERPLAPDRSVIKSEIKGSATWLAYNRALHKIEYWRDLLEKVAAAGHERKAMLLMNINKGDPTSGVTASSLDGRDDA